MSSTSSTSALLARRLLGAALEATPGEGAEHDGAWVGAVERALADVADTLGRWFGPYGYHALLTRALVSTRVAHPALASLRVRAPLEPVLDGLAEAARLSGAPAAVDGLVALVATVVDLLGRMVGADMAYQLLARGLDRPNTTAPDQPAPPGDEPVSERAP